jgi:GcrA cell cycle regulator
MDWSSMLDLRLRVLWKRIEVPMMDLCERLGGLGRDAVLKRADELGLGTRPEITSREAAPAIEVPKSGHIEAPAEAPAEKKRPTLLELTFGQCRWPVNEPDQSFTFCGEEALPCKSYCAAHCRLAYRKPHRWERELSL